MRFVLRADTANDFYVYYLAAKTFARQQNAYTASLQAWANLAAEVGITNYTMPYYYPPLTAQLVWPLTFLRPDIALFLWLALNSTAFIAAGWLLGASSNRPLDVPLALLLTLGFTPTLATLSSGQVNGLLLLSLCSAFYGFSRQRWRWAGWAIAIGVMLKVIPVVHLGHLIWRAQWKAVLICVAGILLLLALALPFTGWTGLIAYSQVAMSVSTSNHLNDFHANQALSGIIARHVGESTPTISLWWAGRIAIVLATIGACWPQGQKLRRYELEFALMIPSISMIMPVTWYHQLVLLLIPLFVITKSLHANVRARWLFIPLALGYGLTSMYGLGWLQRTQLPYLIATSMPFCFVLFLWGILLWLIAQRQ